MSMNVLCRYVSKRLYTLKRSKLHIFKFQWTSGLHNSMRVLLSPCTKSLAHLRSASNLYEPDYLETGKSKIPLYGKLNIQMKGYDFPILENFQKYVNKVAGNMDIEVEDGWATPPQHLKIQKYKPQSTIVDAEYNLSVYERNIQIVDVPSTVFSVFLEVLRTALPEGVTLQVHEHQPEHEEVRYVPDSDLLELKSQLETLGGPSKKK